MSSIWSARRSTSSGIVSCCGTPVICRTTSLSDSMCCTLTVESTSIPASRRTLDILPALRVRRARRVGVGEFIDERDIRMSGQNGVQVQFVERDAPVGHRRDAAAPRVPREGHAVAARPWVSTTRDDHILTGIAEAPAPPRAWRRFCRRRGRRRAGPAAVPVTCVPPSSAPGVNPARLVFCAPLSRGPFRLGDLVDREGRRHRGCPRCCASPPARSSRAGSAAAGTPASSSTLRRPR